MTKNILLIFLTAFLLSSCVTSKRLNYLQKPGVTIPSYGKVPAIDDYKLQVSDQVYIKISTLNEDSKNLFSGGIADNNAGSSMSDLYAYKIYADSCIDFPFVGRIKLAGITTRDAKDIIRNKLVSMIPDCDIDVKLVNSYFTVIGDAGTGRYSIPKEKLNVFQVLAISGDLKPYSDRAKIHVLRPTPNGTQIKTFDVRSKDIINSDFYYIRPNDVIYVQSYNGQFFKFESFSSVITTIATTMSFGYLVYHLSVR